MKTVIRIHFLYRHMKDTIIILYDGNLPHPQCPCCDMLVLWAALNSCHPNTAQCAKGGERKFCMLAAEDMRASTERAFREYGRPLILV